MIQIAAFRDFKKGSPINVLSSCQFVSSKARKAFENIWDPLVPTKRPSNDMSTKVKRKHCQAIVTSCSKNYNKNKQNYLRTC